MDYRKLKFCHKGQIYPKSGRAITASKSTPSCPRGRLHKCLGYALLAAGLESSSVSAVIFWSASKLPNYINLEPLPIPELSAAVGESASGSAAVVGSVSGSAGGVGSASRSATAGGFFSGSTDAVGSASEPPYINLEPLPTPELSADDLEPASGSAVPNTETLRSTSDSESEGDDYVYVRFNVSEVATYPGGRIERDSWDMYNAENKPIWVPRTKLRDGDWIVETIGFNDWDPKVIECLAVEESQGLLTNTMSTCDSGFLGGESSVPCITLYCVYGIAPFGGTSSIWYRFDTSYADVLRL